MESRVEGVSFINVMKWSDEQCREYLEQRRWPDGPICPKCGAADPYRITRKSKTTNKVSKLLKCRACKKQYTSTVGTIFEDSHIPLGKWFAAIYLMCASKKSVSAHQLHRELEVTYKSAWFMCHRIRESMRGKNPTQLAGIVEADETYIGRRRPRQPNQHGAQETLAQKWESRKAGDPTTRRTSARDDKQIVFGIKERGGRVRTQHVKDTTGATLKPIMREHIDMANAHLMTDEAPVYQRISEELPHSIIRHKSEYVRYEGELMVSTNGIESFWGLFKRGLVGTYHHVDAAYLQAYLSEYEFRFNARETTDAERFSMLLSQVQGRLTWYCQKPQTENPFA